MRLKKMSTKIQAIMLMLLSSLCFAAMGAMVKLSGQIPTFEKAFFRNFVSLFFSAFLLMKHRQYPWGKPENRPMLLGRSVFGTIGMLCYFYGIDRLILADSGMLNKMHPFFVTIFAFLFLKEKISWHQLVSLLVALTGSALIIKPGFDFSQSGPAFICFLSAVFAGLAYVFVSYLGNRENSYTIVFWFSLISSLITLPLALMHFRMPSPAQLLLLIGAGGASAGGQFSLTVAYRYAPAGEVSIYNYSNVIFSSIFGFMLFAEIPDLLSVSGYLLIIAAGYLTFRLGSEKRQHS
ncbi:MAG: DMT family transporter [Treponema sp.]|jgi:drug/metabolite transporter (DMT)-like permease|nr:DMT family transporter [Treponema sp.]